LIILQTQNLSKSFGVKPILSDIDIQIQSSDRIGLVGRNGAGKSTLLKMIAGDLQPDSGEIQIAKGIKIGYLAQDSGLETDRTIWEEMITVFAELIEQEKEIRELEKKMADSSLKTDQKVYDQLMKEYSRLTDDFREKGGYAFEGKIRGVLHGLGFQHFDYHLQKIATLSGGQKTRLALAKLLMEEPELLILDEPTNYLDMETLTWLEGYLKNYNGAILFVSHDRYFLDAFVHFIYEIEFTKATKYVGNYSKYMVQKAKEIEIKQKNYERQQQKINQLETFIQKNIARASTTKRAQSRRKMLEKIEKMEKPINQHKKAAFQFEADLQSGQSVLTVKDLMMKFDDMILFQNVSFELKNQERVALIGPNGVGKSTLFKLIQDKTKKPAEGEIHFGANVKAAYYAQEQENLNPEKTVLEQLWDDYPHLDEKVVRTTLGSFLFMGDDVFKQIKELSGGEKARLALAKLMLQKANLLLLDEPTNHLDIYSREVLENALMEYSGTILFISHDRYFLNKLATRTMELTPSGINNYLGDYDYYLEKKAELEEELQESRLVPSENKQNKEQYKKEREKKRLERQLSRNIEWIESAIEQIELEIDNLQSELLQPEVYSDFKLSHQKNEELNQAKRKLEQLLNDWEKAQKELEELL